MTDALDRDLTARLWRTLGSPERALSQLAIEGPRALLPSVYDVDALATASVALSLLTIAELFALRSGRPLPEVRLDRRQVAALFRSERYLQPLGWQLPPMLDGLMGDKPFVGGDRLTMADILLFAFVDFMGQIGQPLSPECKNIAAWFARMKARPSAAA